MGEVVGAGLLSHVPTIMLPKEVRHEINDGKEISLVTGLRRLRSEVLDRLRPDTIVVMDTHWEVTFEHVVTGHDRRSGKFTAGELPRGMRQVPYDFPGDPDSGLRYHWPIARRQQEGPPLPMLIAVRDAARPDFPVLIEGHVRLTAFFLFPEVLPEQMELYLGTAKGLYRWGLY